MLESNRVVMDGGGGRSILGFVLVAGELVTEGEVLIGLALNNLNLFVLILAFLILRSNGRRGGGPVRFRCRGRGNVHGDRGNGLAGWGSSVDGNIRLRRRGELAILGNTENLIDVDVAAVLLDLGVVDEEGILISSSRLPDGVAAVARDNDDGVLAVDLCSAKANFLAGNEVVATFVNNTSVQRTELVG